MTYNGHRNYNYWNVSLWIGNDEGLYNLARHCVRNNKPRKLAAKAFIEALVESGWEYHAPNGAITTPDGAPWTVDAVVSGMRELD